MDMEEVYLRQITEHLKKLNELQETNNDLLSELLQKLSKQIKEPEQCLLLGIKDKQTFGKPNQVSVTTVCCGLLG